MTSQAYQIHLNDTSKSHTSPNLLDNLVLKTVQIPTPGPGEVLVRLRAAALNFRDLLILADSPVYPVRAVPGVVPLADGAGTIEAVGPNSIWTGGIGEGVMLLMTTDDWVDGELGDVKVENTLGCGNLDGTLRQYAVVKDEHIVKKPRNVSFEEAAAMVITGGTAFNILEGIKPGSTVLTQGTGGVSCYAISYAAAMGCKVIATSSSDEKLKIAKKLGAAGLINYKTTPDWEAEALALTNGKGVDMVVDVVGSTIMQSLAAVRNSGTVAVVGFLGSPQPVDLAQLCMTMLVGAKKLRGVLGANKVMMERAVALTEEHDLHMDVKTFEWEDAPKAYEALRSQEVVGKIVIKI